VYSYPRVSRAISGCTLRFMKLKATCSASARLLSVPSPSPATRATEDPLASSALSSTTAGAWASSRSASAALGGGS
jgi:hypothetical protein